MLPADDALPTLNAVTAGHQPPATRLRWDLFCRVVDNYGDLGVCRRVALNLAGLGQSVRLWVDDPNLMSRMAPEIPCGAPTHADAPGVVWCPWSGLAEAPDSGVEENTAQPGDAVVEAFGCDPPAGFVGRMAAHSHRPPVWINLEYLSAEDYVPRSHGLPSPQFAGPGRGLTKWFFYPGFFEATGGLLREHGLLERRAAFDRAPWLSGWGVDATGARVVALFAYPGAPVESWLHSLAMAQTATVVLVTQGLLQGRIQTWLHQHPGASKHLKVVCLPWLSSEDFDHLLWSSDLNLVRGEDSLTRALWAGSPFIWQVYPQHDGVHATKLEAFWRWLWHREAPEHAAGEAAVQTAMATWWKAWNGLEPWPTAAFPWALWDHFPRAAVTALAGQVPLAEKLLAFALERHNG